MLEACFPGQMPPLPSKFSERYSRDQCAVDDPDRFESKDQLLAIFQEQRASTLQLLQASNNEELDRPSAESLHSYAPNVGAVFLMQDVHWTMHAGQWAVIRRQLGRPALF